MKISFKTLFATLLAFVLLFTAVGCGEPPEQEESKPKELINVSLVDFGIQPAVDGSEGSFAWAEYWSADEYIDNLYEPLRQANPNYITRTNIGKDSSGYYDLWEYVFEPENPVQTVWIDTGMHSKEKDAMLAVARIMTMITNEYEGNEALTYLREKVKFIVIPMVNPWGFSFRWPANSFISTGVDVNTTFLWSNKPAEARILMERFELAKSELSFAFDVHSTTSSSYGHYSYRYGDENIKCIPVLDNVVNQLVEKNVVGEADLHYIGKSGKNCFTQNCYTNGFEKIFTLEHGDYIWDDDIHTSEAMTKAVEFIGNCIYAMAIQEF